MSDIELQDTEKVIVDRLKADFGHELPIEPFPDTIEDFKKLPVQNGIVLVGYRGTKFSKPTNTDTIIQETTTQFAITLHKRNLRHEGAYPLLKRIRKSLKGFCPNGDRHPLYPLEEVFLRMDENLWIFGQTFEMEGQDR